MLVKINKVEFPADGKPVVSLSLTDQKGVPIKVDDLEGYGFTVAQVQEDNVTHLTRYQSLLVHDVDGKPYQLDGETVEPKLEKSTQAYADSGGVWTRQGDGSYVYTFKNQLNSTIDPNLLFVVGVFAYKDNRQTAADDAFSSVINGSLDVPDRKVVSNAACDLCHNTLRAHGGTQRAVTLCVTCHTDQTVDPETGNTLNFKVVVHRLHFGRQLPSVQQGTPYLIVGYNQTVHNFSNDNWPQDLRFCVTCHYGGAESANFKNQPNAAACTSCHDTTNLATGDNHPGGIQTDESCSYCHAPDGEEFDASVTGAHTILSSSKKIMGLKLDFASIDGAKPGGSPLVSIRATNKNGDPVDPKTITYLAVTLAGPTSDYVNRWTEVIISPPSASTSPTAEPAYKIADDGTIQYQMAAVIPADATGTYAVGLEGYVTEQVVSYEDPVRVSSYNPVQYLPLDGSKAQTRREVVNRNKCNICHMSITAHGTIRKNLEYCVMCHNAQATDEERRPAQAMPPTTINFPVLIHRLHRGNQAVDPLKVYGYGGDAVDFSSVIFPGNLAACDTCHSAGTANFPLPKGLQPTVITQADKSISTVLPTRAICTSCHDSVETGGHIDLQTSSNGVETCIVCHGPKREFDVTRYHH